MRVGIEALWRVAAAGPKGSGGAGSGGSTAAAAAPPPHQEGRRTLSGWDRDMPEVRRWKSRRAVLHGGRRRRQLFLCAARGLFSVKYLIIKALGVLILWTKYTAVVSRGKVQTCLSLRYA